jgi:hypothetical protein
MKVESYDKVEACAVSCLNLAIKSSESLLPTDPAAKTVAYLEPVDPVEAGRAAAELVGSYPTLAVDPALLDFPSG